MENRIFETLLESEAKSKEEDSNHTSSILDLIVQEKSSTTVSVPGVVVGRLAGFDDAGRPLVSFVSDVPREHVLAKSTIPLKQDHVGSDVVVNFEHGDVRKPVITGSLWHPKHSAAIEAELDGERVTLAAKKEIVLRCGEASITLKCDGKVVIRGTYLVSHAAGVNRIREYNSTEAKRYPWIPQLSRGRSALDQRKFPP
jgi:hypothetical protein